MVQYKRKYVAPVSIPANIKDEQEVWTIPPTGEVFADYDQYLQRMDFYKQRVFSCDATGHNNMNFFEAMSSELSMSQDIDDAFSDPLKAPVLRLIHYSTISRMDFLVDAVYEHLKTEFFPGEWVTGVLQGVRSELLIREKLQLSEMRMNDGTLRPAHSKYGVQSGRDGHEEYVDGHLLSRERNSFTKVNLRAFIKNAVTRETHVGAPWVVRDRYALKYKLGNKPTGESLLERIVKKPNNMPLKYPMEDLKLPPRQREAHYVRPALKREESFEANVIGSLIEKWTFLNIYCECFIFDSFTFDDFVDALKYEDVEPRCELFHEIHCAVLQSLVSTKVPARLEFTMVADDINETHPPQSDDMNGSISREDMEQNGHDMDDEEVKLEVKEVAKLDEISSNDIPMNSQGSSDSQLSDPSPEDRVEELFSGQTWMERLQARQLREGGWQVIIAGILRDLSRSKTYFQFCQRILDHLLPVNEMMTALKVEERYATLNCSDKLRILALLCDFSLETRTVRGYIDECADGSSELRKERLDLQKQRKRLTEELHKIEEHLKKNYPKFKVQMNTSTTATEDGSHAGDETSSHKKLKTDSNELLASLKQKSDTKEQISRIEEIQITVDDFNRQLAQLEIDLREADCVRLRVLGVDRFYNRYWFVEINGMPYGGLPNSSTAQAEYAMARLWVQGPTPSDRHAFLLDRDIANKRPKDEGENSVLHTEDDWGYYDDIEAIRKLVHWCDARGIRETKLANQIRNILPLLQKSFEMRAKYLDPENTPDSRRSTRTTQNLPHEERCLNWHNSTAIELNEILHSDLGKKRRKGVAKIKKRKKR